MLDDPEGTRQSANHLTELKATGFFVKFSLGRLVVFLKSHIKTITINNF
jgi:hypothetical protein